MCGIYGIVNYSGKPFRHAKTIMQALALATQERGMDAVGICSVHNSNICINKQAIAPTNFNFACVNPYACIIMGHNRLATHGSATNNNNNHPFVANNGLFALAHNGIISNYLYLRRAEKLPKTSVETDSYVIVQLLEKYGLQNLAETIEKLNGSFLITIATKNSDFYAVKYRNPIYLVQFPEVGVYMYASTKDIFWDALDESEFLKRKPYYIPIRLDDEEIVKIGSNGQLTFDRFWYYTNYDYDDYMYIYPKKEYEKSSKIVEKYLEEAI